MKACAHRSISWISSPLAKILVFPLLLAIAGCGGATFKTPAPAASPTVNIAASPASITSGSSATLTVSATNASAVTVSGSDGSSYTMQGTGGSQSVSPSATTTYTASATGAGGKVSSTAMITVVAAAPPSPTVTIAANPSSIIAGSSSTLTVAATNATAVAVTGSDGSTYKLPANGGAQVVNPSATTTYTASATGAGGNASAVTAVTVTPAVAGMPSVAISANPTSIVAGASSTLTVTALNATAVTVTGSDGSSYTLSATGGTQAVTPAATTTYTAKATGSGGNATATAVVTVTSPSTPTVTITANPTSITTGGSSTLTVTATNTIALTVTGSDGSSYNLPVGGGTQVVSPTATTTYTANATGSAAKASAVATVTVGSAPPPTAPTVTISANPTSVTAGGTSTLMIAAANATTVTVAGSDGSSYSLSASGGAQAVTPAGSTTYTATATGAGGTVTAATTVTVVAVAPPPAPIVAIAANPATITAGGTSTLTVTAANAATVTVTGSDGSSYNLAATGGTQAVTPTSTATYTATATGTGGTVTAVATVTVTAAAGPTVTITASPVSITTGSSSTLTVAATNATTVTVTGSDGSSYALTTTGGTQAVSPTATTTYTAEADGAGGKITATATVTVTPAGSVQSINHVIFMLQENHTFDNYFGMLNPYRKSLGWNIGDDGHDYEVDGIDDKLNIANKSDQGVSMPLFKLKSTCIDDDSSEWLASYGDVNRYDFATTRKITEDGFVHTAQGFASTCLASGNCNGEFTDLAGQRAMGYYDQDYLNYYYYMAAQFAVSDRWFSPMASKSTPNRIATYTGGTTEGLVRDPGKSDDKLGGVIAPPIFEALDKANVSWKVYYTQTAGSCSAGDDCGSGSLAEPATDLGYLYYDTRYLYNNPTKAACTGTTQPSNVVGDPSNSFCIDPNHIAPLPTYYTDVANGTLASFTFIESGSINDEHPGSGQSVLYGQSEVASIVNAFMASPSWKDSVFFFSYDEGGGPYDHVPPVPGHSNDFTDASLGPIPDIATISVSPDGYNPCLPVTPPATQHCDLKPNYPGTSPGDAATVHGFGAQLGFRLPNIVISPFTRRHYVSHIPMDHTAIMKFVENRFIGPDAHLTARDAVQPNLLDFFDFNNVPWAAPPTPPVPVTKDTLGFNPCTPAKLGP